jgi:hypothetical protein
LISDEHAIKKLSPRETIFQARRIEKQVGDKTSDGEKSLPRGGTKGAINELLTIIVNLSCAPIRRESCVTIRREIALAADSDV